MVFGNDRNIGNNVELIANEAYCGEGGSYRAILEGIQNDAALFAGIITQDFIEAQKIHEGASDEEIVSVMEATGLGMLDKIKGYLKTAWEKIKGLISSFITRLTSVFIRDNKTLVNKHKAAVLKKDLSKFKFKWSEAKNNKSGVFHNGYSKALGSLDTIKSKLNNTESGIMAMMKMGESSKIDEVISKHKGNDFKSESISDILGVKVDYTSAYKDYVENFYDDKEEKEGLSSSLLTSIMTELIDTKEIMKAFKDGEKAATKAYNEALKTIDAFRRDFNKMVPDGGSHKSGDGENSYNKNEAASISKGANLIYTNCQVEQEVATKVINIGMQLAKWKLGEARATFVKAAAYNPTKKFNEQAEYLEFMDSIEENAVNELIDGIYA